MRTIFRLSILITVIFTTSITVILIIAQRLSPYSTEDLPLSDCRLPCIAGSILGQTTIDEAIPQMAKRFAPHGYSLDRRIWGGNVVAVTWEKPKISAINVTFTDEVFTAVGIGIDTYDENMPRLGGLVAALGRPSCISTDRKVFFNVYYFDKQYVLTIGVKALTLDQRIQWITVETVTKPIYAEMIAKPDCAIVSARDWHGFANANYP
jgi:hypothetical protein